MASDDGVLKPGQIIKPPTVPGDASRLAKEIYGLNVTSVKEMKSYDDRNYFIKVDEEVNNPNIDSVDSNGYVLKIINSLDSKNEKVIRGQNDMMKFLRQKGILVPDVIPTVEGDTITKDKMTTVNDDQEEYVVRMFSFIPSKMMCEFKCTMALAYEAGFLAGSIQQALKTFSNEAIKSRKMIWMLDYASDLPKYLFAVKEEEKIEIFKEVLDSWEKDVVPHKSSFEKGYVHGDINEQNILVGVDENDSEARPYIKGIIDFGDVSYSCYVFELAIVITYVLILDFDDMDLLDSAGHVLAGYLKHRPVSQLEWDILKTCISTRLSQSIILGAYSYMNDPGNEYLLTTAKPAWNALKTIWEVPNNQLTQRWRGIIESYNMKRN